jgi:hypothetical protein
MNTLEKMARAMYDRERERMDRLCAIADEAVGKRCHVSTMLPWESCNLLYEEVARAALEAVREPSEAQLLAAKEHEYDPAWPEESRKVYVAMIDAALEGK